jgi:hypothetical protein
MVKFNQFSISFKVHILATLNESNILKHAQKRFETGLMIIIPYFGNLVVKAKWPEQLPMFNSSL